MQVLLLSDVRKLGYIGDIVEVRTGYARNYLLPQGLATAPTQDNIASIQEAKKHAAAERAQRFAAYENLVERLVGASVTIEAAANPEGTLYGSVTGRDIAKALQEQGFEVLPDHVVLEAPIRTLDNRSVRLEFADHIHTEVKVWVVREGALDEINESESDEADGEPTAEVGAGDAVDGAGDIDDAE